MFEVSSIEAAKYKLRQRYPDCEILEARERTAAAHYPAHVDDRWFSVAAAQSCYTGVRDIPWTARLDKAMDQT